MLVGQRGADARGAVRRILASDWAIGGAAAALWVIRYAYAFGLGFREPPQWASWFDQGKYLQSAQAFARGDLTAASHWYPAAYPLLATPFARLFPLEPFFLPDFILFGLACVGFSRALRPLVARWTAALIFTASLLILDNTALFWLEPWTTTLSATLIWWLIAALVDLAFPREARPTSRALVTLGVLAGALPLVRPSDALVSIVVLAITAYLILRGTLPLMTSVAWIALGGIAVVLPFGLLHLAIHGPHPGGYITAGSNQGFAFADLPWRLYVLLITPRPWFPDGQSLIEGLPLLLPGAAGLIVIAVTGSRQVRRWIALVALIAIPYAAIYLAYTDLQPPGLWRFNNAHYFKWLFPLFGLGLWWWLGSFGRLRTAFAATAALCVVMLPACFRLLPKPVPDDQPARMLLFRGGTDRPWSDAYFASSVITDSAGSLVNVGQFHQIPDAKGERAISVIRPFGSQARRLDPGEAAPYRGWQRPYGRYDTRVSLGLPCWVNPAPCRLPVF